MKISLSRRLSLNTLAVLLIGMGIAATLAWLAVERLYLNTQQSNLLAQAQLLASALGSEIPPVTESSPYSQISNVTPGIHTRVIDSQGAVLIDLASAGAEISTGGLDLPQLAQNEAGLVTPQELMNRPEIAQAWQGNPATAIRRVELADGNRVLYAAAPVVSSQGEVIQIVYLATPLPDTQWVALPASVRLQIAAAALIATLLAGAAGWILARRITHPIEDLVTAAQAIANGDLKHEVPEDPGIIELNVLGRTFNAMIASLRRSDQAKTAFISDVTHELRTPLTVIKGTIETLQDGALDDLAARVPFLDTMSRETERLIRLVNDLLLLTRADADALNLQLAPLDLVDLARLRCAYLQPAANLRQVQLKVLPPLNIERSQACIALGDEDRIAQVLDNLLDNAIRYSPAGEEVVVQLAVDHAKVVCQVTDRGPGIPAEHQSMIFERFYRADSARGRAQGGSGLGLSIVRSLIWAQHGEVTVHSVEGQGTTFTFWLPSARV